VAALKRDLERHQIVKKQIREIEQTRLDRLARGAGAGVAGSTEPKMHRCSISQRLF
jgi:hypothetical protein